MKLFKNNFLFKKAICGSVLRTCGVMFRGPENKREPSSGGQMPGVSH